MVQTLHTSTNSLYRFCRQKFTENLSREITFVSQQPKKRNSSVISKISVFTYATNKF